MISLYMEPRVEFEFVYNAETVHTVQTLGFI